MSTGIEPKNIFHLHSYGFWSVTTIRFTKHTGSPVIDNSLPVLAQRKKRR
jgi:hypothetical protein